MTGSGRSSVGQMYRPRFELLDHGRGIAALMVVVYHATAQYRVVTKDPGASAAFAGIMWLGVQLFFVISGYCIAAAVEGSFKRADHPVSGYLVRRVRRIFPPYLIWLVAICIVIGIAQSLAPQVLGRDSYRLSSLSAANWFGNFTLTETWWPYLFGQDHRVITRVGWTLCYEMQFYVVCMLLMFLPRKWFYHGVVTVSVVLLLVFLFERPLGVQWRFQGTFLDGRWLQFAMGIWVFHAMTQGKRRDRIVAGLCLAFVCAISLANLSDYSFGDAIDYRTKRILELGVCSAFSVLLLLLRALDGPVGGARFLKPVKDVGISSYSLYLVHWPICKVIAMVAWKLGLRSFGATFFVTTPVCLVTSVLAGFVFFKFCERPFIAAPSTPVPNSTVKVSPDA